MSTNDTGVLATPHTPSPGLVTAPATVRVKTCCDTLAGEPCDCRKFAAEARGVFAPGRAIMCRPASQWGA
jgi:hypothetical protein